MADLKLHHLNNSRSQKTLWLLEELGAEYELEHHTRMKTMRAPPEFKALHPFASAPLLEIDGRYYPESGAIALYLLSRFDDGKLSPAVGTETYLDFLSWMHFSIAAGMLPIMYKFRVPSSGLTGTPYDEAVTEELVTTAAKLEEALSGKDYLMGATFTAADIQVSFVPELVNFLGSFGDYPATRAWLNRLYARPAFQRSIEIGGAYDFAVQS